LKSIIYVELQNWSEPIQLYFLNCYMAFNFVIILLMDALSEYMKLISMEKRMNQEYHYMTLVALLINWRS